MMFIIASYGARTIKFSHTLCGIKIVGNRRMPEPIMISLRGVINPVFSKPTPTKCSVGNADRKLEEWMCCRSGSHDRRDVPAGTGGCKGSRRWERRGDGVNIEELHKMAAKRRPFPKHKTLAEKRRGVQYEKCHLLNTCGGGFGECEECWYDSEDYWYDCGNGAPTLEEIQEWKNSQVSQ